MQFEIWCQNQNKTTLAQLMFVYISKSAKVQMIIQNEISSKEVKIGFNLTSQTTVKKTLLCVLWVSHISIREEIFTYLNLIYHLSTLIWYRHFQVCTFKVKTYHDICAFDFFLLGLRTSHGLLYFDRATYFFVDTSVEKNKSAIRKQLCDDGLCQKVVKNNVIFISS